jgi:3-methylfumaryl-CoA hydratase
MSVLAALEDLKAHVGRRETATDTVTAAPANLLQRTFGRREPDLGPGDSLPPGWQCLYFLPRFAPDALRPDGSPLDTGVIPPMPLPRRMFAGERFRFHRPLRIGETVRRETELADISAKTGGTGTLVFATVVQRIFAGDALAIEEERRTVFREEVKAGERNQAPRREPAPDDVPWRRRIAPDPVLLFRFSALTFNSHRIHYDLPYARDIERYRGLVVHGPLMASLLLQLAGPLQRFAFRAVSPAIAGEPLHLVLREEGSGIVLGAFAGDGRQIIHAEAAR